MRYVCKMTKVKVKPDNLLRTDEIVGVTDELPTEGKIFTLAAPPLVAGTVRVVTTSLVRTTERLGDEILFNIQNSTYKLELLPEEQDPFIRGRA